MTINILLKCLRFRKANKLNMSIHLSSLCSRKKLQYIFKLIVLVVFVNFVGYVVVSNFILANSNNGQKENAVQSHHHHDNIHNYEKLKFEEFMKKRKEEDDGKQIKIVDDILKGKK
jgi:hypothetical protein